MAATTREIAEAAYRAINRGDLDAFLELVHPDVEFRSLVAEVEGVAFHGHEGVRRWWDEVARFLGGMKFTAEEFVDMGDRGYVQLLVTGTVVGVDVPQRMFQAFVLRDGLPIWWQAFRTSEEAARAVKAYETPPRLSDEPVIGP